MSRIVRQSWLRNGLLRNGLVLCLVLCFACLVAPAAVQAHAFAPSLLELRQVQGAQFAVRFKQPTVRRSGSELRPILPTSCEATGPASVEPEGTGLVATWSVRCGQALVGQTIALEGIAESQADVLLRLEWADGRSMRHVLTAEAPSFVVPAEETIWQVLRGYGVLGVEHILFGFDHLLFVLGLVLLVRGGRRLLLTITAFTLGHSVTLALAALGVVHLPSSPIEALIAFSILVLAVELARRHKTGDESRSWLGRSPWWVASGFGLLHGLGFAGALSEIGLPAGDIPAALFAFNLGIELGQLAFVATVLAAGVAMRRVEAAVSRPETRSSILIRNAGALAPAYLIGCLAAFWTFERILG